jgi:hypothetical protein
VDHRQYIRKLTDKVIPFAGAYWFLDFFIFSGHSSSSYLDLQADRRVVCDELLGALFDAIVDDCFLTVPGFKL